MPEDALSTFRKDHGLSYRVDRGERLSISRELVITFNDLDRIGADCY